MQHVGAALPVPVIDRNITPHSGREFLAEAEAAQVRPRGERRFEFRWILRDADLDSSTPVNDALLDAHLYRAAPL